MYLPCVKKSNVLEYLMVIIEECRIKSYGTLREKAQIMVAIFDFRWDFYALDVNILIPINLLYIYISLYKLK